MPGSLHQLNVLIWRKAFKNYLSGEARLTRTPAEKKISFLIVESRLFFQEIKSGRQHNVNCRRSNTSCGNPRSEYSPHNYFKTNNLETILEHLKHSSKVRMTYKGKRMSRVFFVKNPEIAALYPPMAVLPERVFDLAGEISIIE